MDYRTFSITSNYFGLVDKFDGICNVLVEKLRQFVAIGFTIDDIFIFGFSFGGQLVLDAGRRFGAKVLPRIDGEYIQLFKSSNQNLIFLFFYI